MKTNIKRSFLPLNLQYFAEENTETTDNIENEEQASETSETTEKTSEEATQTKTFTQAELDEIVAKRLERERKKYSDYDDIRAKAEQYEKEAEERKLAEMSEKERAEELAKKYEEEKQQLAQQLDEFKAQIEREKITNEFIKQAQAANIAYIDDAIALADLSAVKVEEGKVVGIDDVVNSLIENKPFLLAQKKEPKTIGDASNPSGNDEVKTLEAQLADAKKAKNFSKVIEISNLIKQKLSN